ncbi:MAG: putative bifunctional diguanylate cyclase/phosphodiesterase [Methylophilaceae bacterium]
MKFNSILWRFALPIVILLALEFLLFALFANRSWLMALLGLVLMVVILMQFYRLALRPLGGEPALAAELMDKIAHGDLEDDGRVASPGTLMDNIFVLRRNLRLVFDKVKHTTDQLSLAASVFEHANDGIFITDAQGSIIEANAAFTKMTGYTRAEAMRETLYTLNFATSKNEMLEEIWPSLSQTGAWHGESRNLRKTGEAYASSIDIFSVRDAKDAVSHYVGVISDITKLKQQQQHLEHMAYHDPLTHLPNRALLSDRLHLALSRLGRSPHLLALCLLDLDGFKPVNDKLGHEAGDYLLVELAQRLTTSLRAGDTVARLGGDEFAILLCDLNNFEECQQALQRLLTAIATPFVILGSEVHVSGSIGLTVSPFEDNTPDTLLRHADQAMYQAKMKGGNCYEIFDKGHEKRARAYHKALDKIETALDHGELHLYYQPKVNMQSGQVIGVEGLIRWQHPKRGLLLPAEFLPAIEATEFSITLGNYVIQQALGQVHRWQQQGLDLLVSVNISARHLATPAFAQQLAGHLASWPQVSPNKLKLEITESTVIGDIAHVAKVIDNCHHLGVEFVLDDFGTGYSSLTYLRRLPVETLKIDQSFVRDMLTNDGDLAIVQGVISLGAAFKRGVIAEGVESAAIGERLVQLGCYLGQGYGIARPMPASDIPAWLQSYKPN